jgi:hypothetical protein
MFPAHQTAQNLLNPTVLPNNKGSLGVIHGVVQALCTEAVDKIIGNTDVSSAETHTPVPPYNVHSAPS